MGLKESFTRERPSDDPLGYDDAASSYFACCLIFCIALPWTYFLIKRLLAPAPSTSDGKSAGDGESGLVKSVQCRCSLCAAAKEARRTRAAAAHKTRRFSASVIVQLILLALLWTYFALVIFSLSGRDLVSTFDPFEVLQVSRFANAKDIKKAYRTLSLRLHPDRNPDDPSAAAQFILINKAYRTLTDEKARHNFELYGNPDGPGIMKVGIGLPKFLIEKGNQIYILLIFSVFLLVVIPAVFITYHRRANKYAANGLRYDTVQLLGQLLSRDMRVRQLLELVAASAEVRECTQADPSADSTEMAPVIEALKDKGDKDKTAARLFAEDPQITRNFHLLLAQCQGKRALLSERLRQQLDNMLRHVDLIAMTMLEIALYHKWTAVHGAVVLMLRELVQSKPVTAPLLSLLQVPHFNNSIVNQCAKGKNGVRNLRGFLELPPSRRRGFEGLTPEQQTDVEEFCRTVPLVRLDAEVFVAEEKEIAEGDIVTIRVTLTRENLAAGEVAGSVHCPEWPYERQEKWIITVSEIHTGTPVAVMETSDCSRQVTVESLRPAPSKGKRTLRVQAASDSYAGLDAQTIVEFEVLQQAEASRAELVHPADLSLDSMPGFFQQLLGGDRQRAQEAEEEEEDDEDASYVQAG